MILGIDTATRTCGVALWDTEQNSTVAEYTLTSEGYIHSRKLVPLLAALLSDAEITHDEIRAVAVVEGPGSFTGLRIGVTAAKLLAYAWTIPVIGVSTLEVLTAGAGAGCSTVGALLDARNRRMYTLVSTKTGKNLVGPGQYELDELVRLVRERVARGTPLLFVGSGVVAYGEQLTSLLEGEYELIPAPAELHQLKPAVLCRVAAGRIPKQPSTELHQTMNLTPTYLRRSSAERKRAQGKGGDGHGCPA